MTPEEQDRLRALARDLQGAETKLRTAENLIAKVRNDLIWLGATQPIGPA